MPQVLQKTQLRYAMALTAQVSQTAACNACHHIEERLARWLLMAHDRAEGNAFPMTHEFLSMMLGVRRSGITIAAGQLQKADLISYQRGRMQITDRSGLEAAACECYGIAWCAYDRLLGLPAGTRDDRFLTMSCAWAMLPRTTPPAMKPAAKVATGEAGIAVSLLGLAGCRLHATRAIRLG